MPLAVEEQERIAYIENRPEHALLVEILHLHEELDDERSTIVYVEDRNVASGQ